MTNKKSHLCDGDGLVGGRRRQGEQLDILGRRLLAERQPRHFKMVPGPGKDVKRGVRVVLVVRCGS